MVTDSLSYQDHEEQADTPTLGCPKNPKQLLLEESEKSSKRLFQSNNFEELKGDSGVNQDCNIDELLAESNNEKKESFATNKSSYLSSMMDYFGGIYS